MSKAQPEKPSGSSYDEDSIEENVRG